MKKMYVISLTSIPQRYPTIRPVLQSLLNQAPPPSRVLLHVAGPPPPPAVVPSGVEIVQVPEDQGPITKVYYALLDPTIDGDTAVLVCDDDCIKPRNWASRLLKGGLCAGEVVSFATIVSGAYGFAFRKGTLSGVPNFFRSLPPCARKIDDDVLTLYCVLSKLPIRKIPRGPVSSVCKEVRTAGPRLVALKGRDARDSLRKQLASHVAALHSSLFFDLRPGRPREKTWAAHPSTFGARNNHPRGAPSRHAPSGGARPLLRALPQSK